MTGHFWVAPPFDGPVTGGTLYNARLAGAIREAGVQCRRMDLYDAFAALRAGVDGAFWVDTLFLDAMSELSRANVAKRALRLIVHYLPSLVEKGTIESLGDLSVAELAAVRSADGFLATSAWTGDLLARLDVPRDAIHVIEPGAEVLSVQPSDVASKRLRAVIVANLVPGKGVEPFLRALEVRSDAPLELAVVGSASFDANYAARCAELVRASPSLRDRVGFVGALTHLELMSRLAGSDVLVSASRMESFGMALADARAIGLPILARRAGNTPALVHEAAGGSSFVDDDALAAALVALASDPAALAERRRRAWASRRTRTWKDAATEFIDSAGRTHIPSSAHRGRGVPWPDRPPTEQSRNDQLK